MIYWTEKDNMSEMSMVCFVFGEKRDEEKEVQSEHFEPQRIF